MSDTEFAATGPDAADDGLGDLTMGAGLGMRTRRRATPSSTTLAR